MEEIRRSDRCQKLPLVNRQGEISLRFIILVILTSFTISFAVEDMPEFIAMELKDTSLVLPPTSQHMLVPTSELNTQLAWMDSLCSLSGPAAKYLIWVHIGECDDAKINSKIQYFTRKRSNHIRVKCVDKLQKRSRTFWVDSSVTFQSENGNGMENQLDTFAKNPESMNFYLKPKYKIKGYKAEGHFKFEENADLWMR